MNSKARSRRYFKRLLRRRYAKLMREYYQRNAPERLPGGSDPADVASIVAFYILGAFGAAMNTANLWSVTLWTVVLFYPSVSGVF